MGASDKLYFRVGNNLNDILNDVNTECVQSTNKTLLTTYTYSKTYYATKTVCGDCLKNTSGDITRKSENATVNQITDDATNFTLDLYPWPIPEEDEDD